MATIEVVASFVSFFALVLSWFVLPASPASTTVKTREVVPTAA